SHAPEGVARQSRDGDDSGDPAPKYQQLRVDNASNRPVNKVTRHSLEERQRAGPCDLDLAERAHVDDADSLPKSTVLFGERLEVGRPGEAEPALVCAGPSPRLSRLEVVGPLPSVLDSEHDTEVLQPRV